MMKVAELELATALAGLTHLQVHTPAMSSLDTYAWIVVLHIQISSVRGTLSHAHGVICVSCSLHSTATRAAVQDLSLECMCGPDGGFLATAPPTLRSLHMEGLPDFKARGLLSQT